MALHQLADDWSKVELRHIRYFIAVAEEGSINSAAARLGISQPPLSHQIRQLESWLDVMLFRRTAKGVELTPAGDAFLLRSRAVMEKLHRATEDARRIELATQRRLVIGCIQSIKHLFHQIIHEGLGSLLPASQIDIKTVRAADQIAALTERKMDLAIVTGSTPTPGIESRLLFEAPLIAAIPMGHSLAKKGWVELRDIADAVGIAPDVGAKLSFREQSTVIFRRCGIAAARLKAASDLALLMQLIEAGMGVGVVYDCAALRHRYPRAVYRPLEGGSERFSVRLAWNPADMSPTLSSAIGCLQQMRWLKIAGASG